MVYKNPFIELPSDNSTVSFSYNMFPSVYIDALYNESLQSFIIIETGLVISAAQVIEWSYII